MFIELDVWNANLCKSVKKLINIDSIKNIKSFFRNKDGCRITFRGKGEYIDVDQTYEEIKNRLDNVKLLA
jgi:hypothetical protein